MHSLDHSLIVVKHLRRLFVIGMVGFVSVAFAADGLFSLVKDGKSEYVIATSAKADATATKSADHLAGGIEKVTGVRLQTVSENQVGDKKAIYVGHTEAAKKVRLNDKGLKPWGFRTLVKDGDVYLLGKDGSWNIQGDPDKIHEGTLKAVTAFLEDVAGVRYLLSGPNGMYYPKKETLEVSSGWKREWNPHIDYFVTRHPEYIYGVANNQFREGDYKGFGGHTYYKAVPTEKYGKTNPEYFAVIAGVRSPGENHLCISNKEVRKLIIQTLEEQADKGYKSAELGQTDGYIACECEPCKAITPDGKERLHIVHRDIAEHLRKSRPGFKVNIIVYGPTAQLPKSFKKYPDNVRLELCEYGPSTFQDWKPFANEFTTYIYNWGAFRVQGFAPTETPKSVAFQSKVFVDNHVKGVYRCGYGELWGLQGITYYVWGKMLADPTQDYQTIEEDFYKCAYGEAYPAMRKFFKMLFQPLDELDVGSTAVDLKRFTFRRDGTYFGGGNLPYVPERCILTWFPPKHIPILEKYLNQALAMKHPSEVEARLRLVEAEFKYLKNLVSVFTHYASYRLNPSWNSFEPLAAAIEERNALIDSVMGPNGKGKAIFGFPPLFGGTGKKTLVANGTLHATVGAPMTWDTAMFREKKILPGQNKKTTHAHKVDQKPVLDGKLDEAVWSGDKEELGLVGIGKANEGSRFKVVYDDEAVYVGIEVDQKRVSQLALKPVGPNGHAYRQECAEIFLDPYGNRDKYYHFIFNPIPNSRYDARKGFIEDPLHPGYHKPDAGWNGDWEYAVSQDPSIGKWYGEARFPFKTLGVSTPNAGDSWALNVARVNRLSATDRPTEQTLWSPSLESPGFGDSEAFGNLIFK
jgi:hypothetical protein